MAVRPLQIEAALALRFYSLNLFGLRQRRKQRLRLCDLRHFRRWRKTFERGREGGVGINGAASGLVEFREWKGGAEFEAASALLPCDGDGGLERLFRRREVGRVAPEQHFA